MKITKNYIYRIYIKIRRFLYYPFRNIGMSFDNWEKQQTNYELKFWKNPEKFEPKAGYKSTKDRLMDINIKMFNKIRKNFSKKVVCEIGCGPYGGILPVIKASTKIGIDPLAKEYSKLYKLNNSKILMLDSMCEKLPFVNESIDAVFCINALDHMQNPFKAIKEMKRVLKKGGYLALSVDIGGTVGHPHIIYESELNKQLLKNFKIIEKQCSSNIKSSWNPKLGIPVYVFQGIKKY